MRRNLFNSQGVSLVQVIHAALFNSHQSIHPSIHRELRAPRSCLREQEKRKKSPASPDKRKNLTECLDPEAENRPDLNKSSALLNRRSLRRQTRRALLHIHPLPISLGFLALIEPPYPIRLLGLEHGAPTRFGQLIEDGIGGLLVEEASLPLPALGLFLPPQLALGVLDLRFLDVHDVHVAFLDTRGDVLPGAVRFVGVLLIERGDLEGGRLGGFGVVGVDCLGHFALEAGAAAGFDGEAVGPLAFDCVEGFFLFAGGVDGGAEGVLFA